MISRKIIGVMAADPQGVIGKDNQLPWHYPGETEHFRNVVNNQIIVMGRKTYDSLPLSVLACTKPVIFSRTLARTLIQEDNKYNIVSSLADFLLLSSALPPDLPIFMIGGGVIARLFLQNNLISEFILTKINFSYNGDTYLDLSLFNNWHCQVITVTDNYTIYNLKK